MCNDCTPPKDDCFKVDTPHCDEGCSTIIPTDCVFHNITTEDQSSKLFNVGITKGSSLNYILKKFDMKLGEFLNTDFSSFNMNDLNFTTPIKTIGDFVNAITKKLKDSIELINTNSIDIEDLETDILDIQERVEELNLPELSNSELNINSSDSVKEVLDKIIIYVNNITIPQRRTFDNSSTLAFDVSSTSVGGSVIISGQPGNIITDNNGLFAQAPSVSGILNTINNSPELKLAFTALVNLSLPCFSFDIMSSSNTLIKYLNCNNAEVSATAKANELLRLIDVRKIITPPAAGLTITFKGIS